MPRYLRFWRYVFGTATQRLIKEGYTYQASALAFTTLISLVPLLSVIVAFIAIFPVFTKVTDIASEYILANFIPASRNIIASNLENFIHQASHLSPFGILFLLATAVMLIITIEDTFNTIWHARKRHKNFTVLLFYCLLVILTPIFIGLSVFLSSYIFSLPWFSNLANILDIKTFLLAGLPLLINSVIFTMLYILGPNHRVDWRNGLLGGFIAAILFEISKKAFAFYLQQFPNYELIYGAFAAIPIFLLWLYIAWLIILFGALISHALYQYRLK